MSSASGSSSPSTPSSDFSVTKKLAVIDTKQIIEKKELGEGAFGKVFYVKCRGKEYALKKFNTEEKNQTAIAEYIKEAKMIAMLESMYTVRIYGQVLDPPGLLLEYMNAGDLGSFIHDKKNGQILTLEVKKQLLLDIATGLEFLHQNGVAHQDIKPANILLCKDTDDSCLYAKISDFGTAKMFQETVNKVTTISTNSASTAFTLFYASPELFNPGDKKKNLFKRDIYSFGVLAYELLTGRAPYADEFYENMMQFAVAIFGGHRPKFNGQEPRDWKKLIEDCWHSDPDKRPTASEVKTAVNKLSVAAAGSAMSRESPEPFFVTVADDVLASALPMVLNAITSSIDMDTLVSKLKKKEALEREENRRLWYRFKVDSFRMLISSFYSLNLSVLTILVQTELLSTRKLNPSVEQRAAVAKSVNQLMMSNFEFFTKEGIHKLMRKIEPLVSKYFGNLDAKVSFEDLGERIKGILKEIHQELEKTSPEFSLVKCIMPEEQGIKTASSGTPELFTANELRAVLGSSSCVTSLKNLVDVTNNLLLSRLKNTMKQIQQAEQTTTTKEVFCSISYLIPKISTEAKNMLIPSLENPYLKYFASFSTKK